MTKVIGAIIFSCVYLLAPSPYSNDQEHSLYFIVNGHSLVIHVTGIPALIVGITLGVEFDTYVSEG